MEHAYTEIEMLMRLKDTMLAYKLRNRIEAVNVTGLVKRDLLECRILSKDNHFTHRAIQDSMNIT